METQRDYYKERIAEEERVRSIYHDLKTTCLSWKAGRIQQKPGRWPKRCALKLQTMRTMCIQETSSFDIILKDKAAKAREKQIDFSALVDFKGMDFIEPLDISTIFGNAIDNAMEASERLPEDQRLVTIKAERVRDMLIITVENNTLPGNTAIRGKPQRKTVSYMALVFPILKSR